MKQLVLLLHRDQDVKFVEGAMRRPRQKGTMYQAYQECTRRQAYQKETRRGSGMKERNIRKLTVKSVLEVIGLSSRRLRSPPAKEVRCPIGTCIVIQYRNVFGNDDGRQEKRNHTKSLHKINQMQKVMFKRTQIPRMFNRIVFPMGDLLYVEGSHLPPPKTRPSSKARRTPFIYVCSYITEDPSHRVYTRSLCVQRKPIPLLPPVRSSYSKLSGLSSLMTDPK